MIEEGQGYATHLSSPSRKSYKSQVRANLRFRISGSKVGTCQRERCTCTKYTCAAPARKLHLSTTASNAKCTSTSLQYTCNSAAPAQKSAFQRRTRPQVDGQKGRWTDTWTVFVLSLRNEVRNKAQHPRYGRASRRLAGQGARLQDQHQLQQRCSRIQAANKSLPNPILSFMLCDPPLPPDCI